MTAKCWCRHGRESHAEGRAGVPRCIPCERADNTPRLFDPAHRYQPIDTLRPLPQYLFREAE